MLKSNEMEWLNIEQWQACEPCSNQTELMKLPCVVGLDLSSKINLSSAVAVFQNGRYLEIKCRFWMPSNSLNNEPENSLLRDWAEQGYIKIVKGDAVEHSLMEQDINSWLKDYQVHSLGLDAWASDELWEKLYQHDDQVVKVRPGQAHFSKAMIETEMQLLADLIRHDHNPVMQLMISNVIKKVLSKNLVSPRKINIDSRITGPIALLTAVGCLKYIKVSESVNDL